MSRNATLDILKALGILLVIIGHNTSGLLFQYIYSFHMPMFFILAGYLYKEKGILDSITHDFKRIILPYLLYFVVLSLFNNLCYGITISRLIQDVIMISWGSVIRLDIYGHHVQGVGYLWFLPALFVCKNVFNIIYRVWKPITHSYGMYVCW